MKSIACCGLSVLAAATWTAFAIGQEFPEGSKVVEFIRVGKLEDVEGRWASLPEGARSLGGDYLVIKGNRCRYCDWSDTPATDFRIDFDVAVEDGVLVLKTDNPKVPAKKWRLTKLGETECLVVVVATEAVRQSRVFWDLEAKLLYRRTLKGFSDFPEKAKP